MNVQDRLQQLDKLQKEANELLAAKREEFAALMDQIASVRNRIEELENFGQLAAREKHRLTLEAAEAAKLAVTTE